MGQQEDLKIRQFERLIATAPDGVIAHNRAGEILLFNTRAEAILGFQAAEILGKPIADIFAHPDQAQQIVGYLQSAPDGTLREYTTELLNIEGERVPIRLAATWLYDDEGNPIGTVGYFRDLRVVEETQERLNLLLAASNLLAEAENLTGGLQDLAQLMVNHLGASFCRIFLLDPLGQYLTTVAASPLPEIGTALNWQPGLGSQTAVADWPRLDELLYEKAYSLIKSSGNKGGLILQRWSQLLHLDQPIQFMLVVPLRVGSQVLGLLELSELPPWAETSFSADRLELTLTIARQTAVLIERLKTLEETERRGQLMATLDETSRRILALHDTARIRHEIIRLAAELAGCNIGGLFYFDSQTKMLTLAEGYGLPEALLGSRLRAGDGLLGQVAKLGLTLSTNEYQTWPDKVSLFAPVTIETMVGIPIKEGDRVTAVLFVADDEKAHRLFEMDIDILERFSLQAAIGLEKARLLGQSEQARAQLHQSYQASNALVLTRDPQQVWRDIVTQVKEVARAGGVRMFLIEAETGLVSDLLVADDDQVNAHSVIRPDGLSMQVVQTGQVQIVRDYEQEQDRANPSFFERGIRAAVGLPVAVEGRCIGVMWVYYNEPRSFSDWEIEALQLFVNQAAIAYENARKMKELEHMRQAAEALAGAADLKAVLNQIVVSACQVLQADSAVIWSYDDTRLEFVPDASVSVGIPDDLWRRHGKPEPREGGTTHTVLQLGWVGVHDVTAVDQYPFMGDSTLALLQGAGMRSFQGLALGVGEEKLGVLYVNYKRPKMFLPEEQEIAKTFAHHAALALRNARLLTQLGRAREMAAVVADVTTLANLQDTLESIAKAVADVVHCDVVTLHVYDQDRQNFVPPPTLFGAWYPERLLPYQAPSNLALQVLEQPSKRLIAEETGSVPLFKESRFTLDEKIASCVAVRLQIGSNRVGVLFISYRKQHRFAEAELVQIDLFANQAAVAIHNAQLYERMRRRTAALESLHEGGKAITSTLNLDESLEHIAEQAWALVSFHERRISYASIWLFEDGRGAKVVAAYPVEELERTRQALGESVVWQPGESSRFGIMYRAYKTGQPQLVSDVETDPDYLPSHPETRSELVVPIVLENEAIGVINVEHSEWGAFDIQDIRALEALAAQAAIAIQNARLYDTAVQQARLLNLAAQVAADANSTLDESKLLKKIVHAIATGFGFYHVAIFLLDDAGEFAIMRAASSDVGRNMMNDGYRLRVGDEGLVGYVATQGRYQLISDVSQDPHFLRNPLLQETQSEMTFPLNARGKTLGVLDLQHRRSLTLREEQIATLETMTNQIANSIHNAQLYAQAEGQAVALQALFDAGQAVTESLDLDEILTNIVEQAWRLTGTRGQYAQFSCLLLHEGERLQFAAAYPRHELISLRENPGSISLVEATRYGITGRAFKTGKPQLVGNIKTDPDYLVHDPATCSELAVPIRVEGHVIGVINVEHPQPDAFDQQDVSALEALATQAAIAIQNAEAYREARTLQDVAAALAGAQSIDEMLQLVLHAAMRLTRTASGGILFWDKENERFDPAYRTLGPGQPLEKYQTSARRSGFTRKVVVTRQPVFIYDSHFVTNINPVVLEKGRRSLIGVPVMRDGEVIAVIHVYSPHPRHFTQHQVASLETLAAQAGVALARAQTFEELKETKGLVGARTALAWMGMASNAWRHSITADAVNIRNAAALLQLDMATAVADEAELAAADEKLALIQKLASRVLDRPITPPLSAEEGAGEVVVNDLIRERLQQLWQDEAYAVLEPPRLRLTEADHTTVWASAEWLRHALDLVVDNAIDAMRQSEVKALAVETAVSGRQVEIAIRDTGPGIPADILPELFRGNMKRPRREGHLGRGLLMVQAIIQTYGGDVFVRESSSAGTTMVLALPIYGSGSR